MGVFFTPPSDIRGNIIFLKGSFALVYFPPLLPMHHIRVNTKEHSHVQHGRVCELHEQILVLQHA